MVPLSHAESARHSKEEGQNGVSAPELTMESVTTDKPDAPCACVDEHPGSSSTANGFSHFYSYLSKRNYPRCLCVTAFQMVHFQIAYHSSWWSYIPQPYEMGCCFCSQQQEGTQDCGLFGIATAYSVAMGENSCNVDYNQTAI